MIKRIIFRTLRWKILMQVLLWLMATFALSVIPTLNKYLIDVVFPNGGRGLVSLIAMYLTSYVVFLVATWGSERYVWRCAILFENTLKKLCFDKMVSKRFSSFSEKKSDEYLSLMTNNITRIEQDYLQPICALIKSGLSVCVYTIVISLNTTPILCVFLVSLSIIAAFTPRIYKNPLKRAGKEYVDQAADYTKKLADLLDGFELVDNKSRQCFSQVNSRFTDLLSHKRLILGRRKVDGNTISGTVVCIIDLLTFVLCGTLLVRGKITAGTVLAAIAYAQSFTEPVQEILYDLNSINVSKGIVAELEKIITESPEALCLKSRMPSRFLSVRGLKVNYTDKSFVYTADFVAGKKYLITGESGSGKSTLLDALTGRCNHSDNLIIDGLPGNLDDNKVFYLTQNQHVFSTSFQDNVTVFGAYPFPSEMLLEKMPLCRNLVESPDCSLLSGGEQQVMKICRMISQEKELLFLDEPFIAVDRDNRKKIFHLLTELDTTLILVAHDVDFDDRDLSRWNVLRIEDICNERRL